MIMTSRQTLSKSSVHSSIVYRRILANSLWPSDDIWRHKSESTLAQVMACCLTAPSHYLNQCWLIIRKARWYSSDGNSIRDNSAMNRWNLFQNYLSKSILKSPRGQCVKPAGMETFKYTWGCRDCNEYYQINCSVSPTHGTDYAETIYSTILLNTMCFCVSLPNLREMLPKWLWMLIKCQWRLIKIVM